MGEIDCDSKYESSEKFLAWAYHRVLKELEKKLKSQEGGQSSAKQGGQKQLISLREVTKRSKELGLDVSKATLSGHPFSYHNKVPRIRGSESVNVKKLRNYIKVLFSFFSLEEKELSNLSLYGELFGEYRKRFPRQKFHHEALDEVFVYATPIDKAPLDLKNWDSSEFEMVGKFCLDDVGHAMLSSILIPDHESHPLYPQIYMPMKDFFNIQPSESKSLSFEALRFSALHMDKIGNLNGWPPECLYQFCYKGFDVVHANRKSNQDKVSKITMINDMLLSNYLRGSVVHWKQDIKSSFDIMRDMNEALPNDIEHFSQFKENWDAVLEKLGRVDSEMSLYSFSEPRYT